jgi:hypothetical protein
MPHADLRPPVCVADMHRLLGKDLVRVHLFDGTAAHSSIARPAVGRIAS